MNKYKLVPVEPPIRKLGIMSAAFDTPSVRRAYTYSDQPDNATAWKLGRAARKERSGGDLIDYGLQILRYLQGEGFGVFEIDEADPAPQPAEQQSAPVFSDEDHVSIPRGLITAACSAIDKKRDGTKTLAELRRYTFGDLSKQPAPDVAGLVEALESLIKGYVGLLEAGRDRIISLGGDCDPVPVMEQSDPWLRDARAALAAHRKQDSQPCPAIQERYAGATVWIGDKRVTQVVTEGSLKHESEPGMAITHAAQACLDLLAAAHRKGGDA